MDKTTSDEITPQLVFDAKLTIIFVDGKKKVLLNGCESGLSESKAKYMKSLAEHYLDETSLKGVNLHTLDDEILIEKLTSVKGLGLWSVHMYMIFDLFRPNVLAEGDLGVKNGMAAFFGVNRTRLEGECMYIHICFQLWTYIHTHIII